MIQNRKCYFGSTIDIRAGCPVFTAPFHDSSRQGLFLRLEGFCSMAIRQHDSGSRSYPLIIVPVSPFKVEPWEIGTSLHISFPAKSCRLECESRDLIQKQPAINIPNLSFLLKTNHETLIDIEIRNH